MSRMPAAYPLSKILAVCALSLCLAAFVPNARAQRGSVGGHGGVGHAGGGGHASVSGRSGGGGHGGGGRAFGSSGGAHEAPGMIGGAGSGSNSSSSHSTGRSGFFRWLRGNSTSSHSANASPAENSAAGAPASRNYTRSVFVAPASRSDAAAGSRDSVARFSGSTPNGSPQNDSTNYGSLNARPYAANNYLWQEPPRAAVTSDNWRATSGMQRPQPQQASGQWTVALPASVTGQPEKAVAPSRPQGGFGATGQWLVTGGAQQQRPAGSPPAMPQAPRPIANPPQSAIPPRPAMPVQNPIRPINAPPSPVTPPIARIPGQPVARFPIAQPPVMRFPVALPPVGSPPVQRVRIPVAPIFHPVLTPPGRPPIRRIGPPVTRPPLGSSLIAPPIRTALGGMSRHGAPFVVMTAPPPHFVAHPCVDTITHCGFGFGFDGDFDFDDGFFFGFPFGSPFFFGPFGFPIFGFGPNCFFDGVVEPCAFTPLGFSQFQAFGPNGWGWSWLGWGNGWFYSPPEEPPPPPWNSTESTPQLNLQSSFTSEYYMPEPVPYSEPQPGAAPGGNEPGAQQKQNVVTDIVTTDGIVIGATSYWLADNQLCYVTTYNIKNCIPMSRVDLQKTVDMNYKRGVKFTLTPAPPDSQKQQPPDSQDQQP